MNRGGDMTSEIKRIKKNLTYRIVTIDGENYLMDTGAPFWKGLFPYSFWLFPHPAYKLDDEKVLNEVEETTDLRGRTLSIGLASGGGGILISPLVENFNIPSSPTINIVILIFALTITLLMRIYYSKRNREQFHKIANIENLKTEELVIRPSSVSYFIKFSMFYVFLLGMSILSVGMFVEYGNILALLLSMVFFFFFLIFNSISVIPDQTYGKLANPK